MAFFKLTSGDITGFKVLFALAIMYGLISYIVHSAIYMEFIKPLGIDAPLDRFSEARAIEHVRVLSEDIGGRQVNTSLIHNNFFVTLCMWICVFFF